MKIEMKRHEHRLSKYEYSSCSLAPLFRPRRRAPASAMPQLALAAMWAKASGRARASSDEPSPAARHAAVDHRPRSNADDVMQKPNLSRRGSGTNNTSRPPSARDVKDRREVADEVENVPPNASPSARDLVVPRREALEAHQTTCADDAQTRPDADDGREPPSSFLGRVASEAAGDDGEDAERGDDEMKAEERNDDPVHYGGSPRVQPSEDLVDGAEYEREREARIARNREIMRSLGIASGAALGDPRGAAGRSSAAAAARRRRETRRRAESEAIHAPVRRSTRSTRHVGSLAGDVDVDAAAAAAAAAAEEEEEEEVPFDDSSVLRYVCGGAGGIDRVGALADEAGVVGSGGVSTAQTSDGGGGGGGEDDADDVLGFAQLPVVFADDGSKKGFYSLDATDGLGDIEGDRDDRALLVGGGDGGRVSVFGLDIFPDVFSDDAKDATDPEKPIDGVRVRRPLMSWVAHRGWCSQVQFMPPAFKWGCDADSKGHLPFVVTAGGMDGVVALWDISRHRRGEPSAAATAKDLHSAGVFSMHAASDARLGARTDGEVASWKRGDDVSLLTGSKDATVVLSRVAPSVGIVAVRRFEELHGGVVKCVRWRGGPRGEGIFASCANDGRVCVVDTRTSGAPSAVPAIDGAHGGKAVNFVEWGSGSRVSSFSATSASTRAENERARPPGPSDASPPESDHLLLTSGLDREVRVWDVRKMSSDGDATAPLLRTMSGHAALKVSRPKMIYHPVFHPADVRGRRPPAVVTPGEGSGRLSLYGVADGRAISRGEVGFDATAVFARGGDVFAGAGSGAGSSAGRCPRWSLALAHRGEVRLYRPMLGRLPERVSE